MCGQNATTDSDSGCTLHCNGRCPTLPGPVRADAHLHPPHKPTGTKEAETFYPTMAEFLSFPEYLRKIERTGAHVQSGICKVVPPEGWKSGELPDLLKAAGNHKILKPVYEIIKSVPGSDGFYTITGEFEKKSMLGRVFAKKSKQFENLLPQGCDVPRTYFENIEIGTPLYGSDSTGSLFGNQVGFNPKNLGTILNDAKINLSTRKAAGITKPMLYYGSAKTTFPWHAEDMDLYSINYLHFGKPKYWYAISEKHADAFEKMMRENLPNDDVAQNCDNFMLHKNYIASPAALEAAGIPYSTMVQRENEFIITFPRGYHMGFNSGFNLAESVNMASDRWIDFGIKAKRCTCPTEFDFSHIDMVPYMKEYRKDQFHAWYRQTFSEDYVEPEQKAVKRRASHAIDEAGNVKKVRRSARFVEKSPIQGEATERQIEQTGTAMDTSVAECTENAETQPPAEERPADPAFEVVFDTSENKENLAPAEQIAPAKRQPQRRAFGNKKIQDAYVRP